MPLKAEGEFALVREKLENALLLSGQPVKRGTMAHDHDVYMMLTDTAAQQYDAAAIELYVPRLEELAQRDNHKMYLAIAQRARGIAQRLAQNYGAAENSLLRALETFDAMGAHWQSGRTLSELGELERARSNTERAREYFARAADEFETLGAAPDAERARAALEEAA